MYWSITTAASLRELTRGASFAREPRESRTNFSAKLENVVYSVTAELVQLHNVLFWIGAMRAARQKNIKYLRPIVNNMDTDLICL